MSRLILDRKYVNKGAISKLDIMEHNTNKKFRVTKGDSVAIVLVLHIYEVTIVHHSGKKEKRR